MSVLATEILLENRLPANGGVHGAWFNSKRIASEKSCGEERLEKRKHLASFE
jgi:hypothetical protein